MAKGYWIARVDVHDPEAYKRYLAVNEAVFRRFGGKFVVRELLERGGLTTGAVEQGAHSLMYSSRRPFGDDWIGRQTRLQPLQGDATIEREVGGEPHLGHATLGQTALQPVAAGEDDRSITLVGRRAWSGGRGRSRHSATSN